MRGATSIVATLGGAVQISIHAPHAGSDLVISYPPMLFPISIHAPHAGSDPILRPLQAIWGKNFNPRSPCGERRTLSLLLNADAKFQSTLPMRGATDVLIDKVLSINLFQSTLPMRGATTSCLLWTP